MPLKRSTFRKPTYTEALAKKVKATERAVERKKAQNKLRITKGTKKPSKGKKQPKTRRKKSDLQKLKAQLWKLCREIQIKRYGRTCYCCGAKDLQGSNCHLGHFIPSSICSTEMRYDLNNLRPSCYHCNINLSGNWIGYEKHLIADGIDVQGLKDRNEKTKGGMFRADWYREKIAEYSEILEQM